MKLIEPFVFHKNRGKTVGILGALAGRAEEFDIVVYGGTPGGIAAAVTAARLGHSVALVEYHAHLGGMAAVTLEGGVSLMAPVSRGGWVRNLSVRA